ncbi:MAG: hypothetical protein V2I33_20420, partial [Kangiellaceae bacterium]|nr:hypothetical protein [Kangiellaceae bacterium]
GHNPVGCGWAHILPRPSHVLLLLGRCLGHRLSTEHLGNTVGWSNTTFAADSDFAWEVIAFLVNSCVGVAWLVHRHIEPSALLWVAWLVVL